jgi:hypothetical protein
MSNLISNSETIANPIIETPLFNLDDDTEIVVLGRKLGFCNGWDGIPTDGKIYMVYGFYPLNPNIKIPASDLVEFDYHNGKIELFSLKDSIPELVASMDMIEILRFIPMIEDIEDYED